MNAAEYRKLEGWAKANGYRVSYRGVTRMWVGVLKCNGELVWECGHYHDNRDSGNPKWGGSARGCASDELLRRWQAEA